jgi:hypothetical protein
MTLAVSVDGGIQSERWKSRRVILLGHDTV